MSQNFELIAEARNDLGKGASRRLRREAGKVPAVIYGGSAEPQSITLIHKDLWRAQEDEAFYTSILRLVVDGTETQAVIKDIQRHPAKELILHCDFLRVDANTPINVHVPLHYINEEKCIGVRMQGGTISHSMVEVEVRCLPANLPEYIEVDMENVNAGTTLHISDLNMPEGVESVALSHGADHDLAIAQCAAPRGKKADAEESEESAGE